MRHAIFGGSRSTGDSWNAWARGWLQVEASTKRVFKCEYTQALVDSFKWQNTAVDEVRKGRKAAGITQVTSARLTRFDGVIFNLVKNSGCCFYILFNDSGLELIYVFNIIESGGIVKVVYWRVLSTSQAIVECPSYHDVTETGTRAGGGLAPVSLLGRKSLESLKSAQDQDGSHRSKPVFHRGNNALEAPAEYLVGVVGWMTDRANRDAEFQSEDTMLVQNLRRSVLTSIRSLDDIDVVVAGDWFFDDKQQEEPEIDLDRPLAAQHRKRKDCKRKEQEPTKVDTGNCGGSKLACRKHTRLDDSNAMMTMPLRLQVVHKVDA
jgi:hypothetical protein